VQTCASFYRDTYGALQTGKGRDVAEYGCRFAPDKGQPEQQGSRNEDKNQSD
jgi:hypothetical protein